LNDVDRGKPQFCLTGLETGEHTTFPHDMSWRMGQNSSVGIVTRYWLGGPGIESQWGRDFSHPSGPALRLTQSPIQWMPGLSRG